MPFRAGPEVEREGAGACQVHAAVSFFRAQGASDNHRTGLPPTAPAPLAQLQDHNPKREPQAQENND